jgi:hypothetical protein
MTFKNAILNEQDLHTDSKPSLAGLVVGPSKTKKGNQVIFDAYHGIIAPNETLSVKLTANCLCQETIEEYFEIMVKDSQPCFFQLLGEVQVPKIFLNRETIELGKIYAGIKETIDCEHGKYKT